MAKSKDKKRDTENGEGDENKDDTKSEEPTLDYDELVKRVCAIAKPLAGKKLTKRLYKTVKKGKRFDYDIFWDLHVLVKLTASALYQEIKVSFWYHEIVL